MPLKTPCSSVDLCAIAQACRAAVALLPVRTWCRRTRLERLGILPLGLLLFLNTKKQITTRGRLALRPDGKSQIAADGQARVGKRLDANGRCKLHLDPTHLPVLRHGESPSPATSSTAPTHCHGPNTTAGCNRSCCKVKVPSQRISQEGHDHAVTSSMQVPKLAGS